MATPAPVRRLAHAAVALAITGPAVLLGGTAWADDPTPAPAEDSVTEEAPVVQPSIGSWIIGGTLLEGTAATPAKPAVKPAAKPAAPTTRTRSTATRRTSPATTTARTGPTALPFTGNRVDTLLPVGVSLLVGGVALMLAGRPRRVTA